MNQQIQRMLGQAIQAFQNGNVAYAKSILKIVLQSAPNFAPALQIAGLIYASEGGHSEAIQYLSKAVKFAPNDAAIRYNLAKALSSLGQNDAALPHHLKSVQLAPTNPEAFLNYGLALSHLGRHKEALNAFEKALLIAPNYAEAMLNAGIVYTSLRMFKDAQDNIWHCLNLKPDLPAAWIAMGEVNKQLDQFNEAIENYLKALDISPENFDALMGAGLIYLLKNDSKSALDFYLRATRAEPKKFQGWANLGVAYLGVDELNLALTAISRALDLNPKAVNAHANAGLALLRLEKFNDAIQANKKAIEIDPLNIDAHANLGLTYLALEHYEQAIISLSKALDLNPSYKWIEGVLIHAKLQINNWDLINQSILKLCARVSQGNMVTPPYAALSLSDDPAFHSSVAKIWIENKLQHSPTFFSAKRSKSARKKIKLAYFSSDFRSHPVGMLMQNIIKLHDRETFEVLGFFLNENENLDDIVTKNLKLEFDQNYNMYALTGKQAISFLLDHDIDIAIDLNGHTSGNRVEFFLNRIAPIQINYLGYPGTMGANSYDYIIADQFVIPKELRPFYFEKMAYMPNCFFPADGTIDLRNSLMAHSRESQDLPTEGFIFACFNNSFKITPEIFEVWMNLLGKVTNSVLWLTSPSSIAIENLKIEAKKFGIDTSRLIFARRMESRADHLSRLALADLFLDTPNYNAHTTAVDALWAGLPVLTITGKSFASRVAGSLLSTLGLDELIASDKKTYFDRAHELAVNKLMLKDIKNKLCNARLSSGLFNDLQYTRSLEELYRKMYINYENGNATTDLA